jgi:hypothetical protein
MTSRNEKTEYAKSQNAHESGAGSRKRYERLAMSAEA